MGQTQHTTPGHKGPSGTEWTNRGCERQVSVSRSYIVTPVPKRGCGWLLWIIPPLAGNWNQDSGFSRIVPSPFDKKTDWLGDLIHRNRVEVGGVVLASRPLEAFRVSPDVMAAHRIKPWHQILFSDLVTQNYSYVIFCKEQISSLIV